jgi:hypothetical protein
MKSRMFFMSLHKLTLKRKKIFMMVGKIRPGIRVHKAISYDAPEGLFNAVCFENIPIEIKGKLFWRIKFELLDPSFRTERIFVAKNLLGDLESGSRLRQFIDEWLGEEFLKDFVNSDLQPEFLIGKTADVLVSHIHNPTYPSPFCDIKAIYPPGTRQVTRMAA